MASHGRLVAGRRPTLARRRRLPHDLRYVPRGTEVLQVYGESVVGVIANARMKTGMLKSECWFLVVTTHRLLGAHVTDELLKRVIEQARAQAKASGSGFFGQWGAQLKVSFGMAQRYLAMDPEAIVGETPGNWALYPGQVSWIKVEDKSRPRGEDDEQDYLRITIATPGGQGTYDTDGNSPNRDQARALLYRVFGPIIH
jgi:hypothetical protein